MRFMRHLVLNKPKITQSTDRLPHEPFRLNTETEQASSWFEIVFFIDDVKYRYGFEADSSVVYAEWLYIDEKGKEARLFEREREGNQGTRYINKQKFKEGIGVKVSDNHLFIWKCDQNDGEISRKILQWFDNFNFIDGLEDERYLDAAFNQIQNTNAKSKLLKLVKFADLGIESIALEEKDITQDFVRNAPFTEEMKKNILETVGCFQLNYTPATRNLMPRTMLLVRCYLS